MPMQQPDFKQLSIARVVLDAEKGRVGIPEFQRDFVWRPRQVRDLAESLHAKYPVGAILHAATHDKPQIVDGQQRTMAMCLLFGRRPAWLDDGQWSSATQRFVTANVFPENGENISFSHAATEPRSPLWTRLPPILGLGLGEEDAGQVKTDVRAFSERLARKISDKTGQRYEEVFARVHDNIGQLREIHNIMIPVVEIAGSPPEVQEVFDRLNRKGTRLKEADVQVGLLAVENRGWEWRKDYNSFCARLKGKGWDLGADPGILVRAAAGIGEKRGDPKRLPKEFWQPARFRPIWRDTKRAVDRVIALLGERGITNADLLASRFSMSPLCIAHHAHHQKTEYKFGRLFRWFLRANLEGRYSGSSVSELDKDVRGICQPQNFVEMVEALEEVLDGQLPQRKTRFAVEHKLMLYAVLRHFDARDWLENIQIGASLASGGWDLHHIFPKSMLHRNGITDQQLVNSWGNLTPLTHDTNDKLKGDAPAHYIRTHRIPKRRLLAHGIPEEFVNAANQDRQWAVNQGNFARFVKAREKRLAEMATEFMASLKG